MNVFVSPNRRGFVPRFVVFFQISRVVILGFDRTNVCLCYVLFCGVNGDHCRRESDNRTLLSVGGRGFERVKRYVCTLLGVGSEASGIPLSNEVITGARGVVRRLVTLGRLPAMYALVGKGRGLS